MNKAKQVLVIALFALIIFGLAVVNILTPDGEISASERRRLAQFPEITADTIFNAQFSEDLEEYLLDQFPARDYFRRIKAGTALDLFRLSDNNGLYMHDGVIYKLEYPLKEDQLLLAAGKIESIVARFTEIDNAYFSIIPDKNYFSPVRDSHTAIDYDELNEIMLTNVSSAEYIDIYDCLDIGDYYATDTHWRQEKLSKVVERLCERMGATSPDFSQYQINSAGSFTGILAGQLAMSMSGEEMFYLTSAATENASVASVEQEGSLPVYTLDKFSSMEPYDIFLSGAQAIMTISNENAKTDKHLIIFRDSFGSSLAPLLTDSYSKITLVDLRYVSSSVLDDYVDFTDADLLFIYSTALLNSASLLR